MNTALKGVFKSLYRFFSVKLNLKLSCLVLIVLVALIDFIAMGQVRRTFVFFSALEGKTVVEERMLRRSSSGETGIRRYVEEVLLGPASPGSLPLFPRETRLLSLMLRDGTVYAGFSADAAFPGEGGDVFESFLTLNRGIRRNFMGVKNVKFFIGGNEIFFSEFSRIFADSADNIVKPVNRR